MESTSCVYLTPYGRDYKADEFVGNSRHVPPCARQDNAMIPPLGDRTLARDRCLRHHLGFRLSAPRTFDSEDRCRLNEVQRIRWQMTSLALPMYQMRYCSKRARISLYNNLHEGESHMLSLHYRCDEYYSISFGLFQTAATCNLSDACR